MPIDTERLVHIANELKSIDQQREKLLAELQRLAGEVSGGGPAITPRRGRPPRALPAPAPSQAPLTVHRPKGGRRKKGLTTAVVDFLTKSGGAHTAGEIVAELKLPKTTSQIASVSTTLVRLARIGRVKKDKERGYRVA
jgi:hypothetical protein